MRIDIPGEIRDIYRLWRATPLNRACRLEKALDTSAHIYYKYEGTSPAGSHKPNTTLAQACYNKRPAFAAPRPNRRRPVGQALSLTGNLFALECTVVLAADPDSPSSSLHRHQRGH